MSSTKNPRRARFEQGKSVDVEKYLRDSGNEEAADAWVEMNEKHRDKFKTATVLLGPRFANLQAILDIGKDADTEDAPTSQIPGDEVQGRFEEGAPADPTENMSEEDKKKWEDNTEEYGDKFKKATAAGKKPTKPAPELDQDQLEQIDQIQKYLKAVEGKGLSGDAISAGIKALLKVLDEQKKQLKKQSAKKPTQFSFTIDIDERGEFRATVYGPNGKEVLEVSDETFEDGWMRNKNDMAGLAEYLEHLGIGGPNTRVKKEASIKEAAGGLYGFTKGVQSDCESAIKKLTKAAARIAKSAYAKDEKIGSFFATRAKRASDTPSEILVAALKTLGPKVAAKAEEMDEEEKPTKEAAGKYGLYGFSARTTSLGLTACSEMESTAGEIACDLHARRADKHAHITGFLGSHAKEANCVYSRLLQASYPDSERKVASGTPRTVAEWLNWEE